MSNPRARANVDAATLKEIERVHHLWNEALERKDVEAAAFCCPTQERGAARQAHSRPERRLVRGGDQRQTGISGGDRENATVGKFYIKRKC